ncbi:MAG: HEAT repeat domain-containing protein [Bryobacterales bacterium]|nr:HEAT repeat domain-containing protein [Bryobacterales bacterium]
MMSRRMLLAVASCWLMPTCLTSQTREEQVTEQLKMWLLPIDQSWPELKAELDKIGPPSVVIPALLRILEAERHAAPETRGAARRLQAVSALGNFRERSAMPIMRSILADGALPVAVRRTSARALGRIDPVANKDALLSAFDQSERKEFDLRIDIAKALIETRDRAVLDKMEQWARGNPPGSLERKEFDLIVSEMRKKVP